EELGDEQVLPLGSELDEPVGLRRRETREMHLVQRVVLLLDEAPHRVKRLLVLEAAVHQLPAELVPAVGPQVVPGVELPEEIRGRTAADADAQRRGTGRAGE